MASPREYLQSIIKQCAEIQDLDDDDLVEIELDLKQADDVLDTALTHLFHIKGGDSDD